MRMRNRNRSQTSFRLDEVDRFVVEERDTVPEDIAVGSLDENRTLTDGELRFGEDRMDVGVDLVGLESVAVVGGDLTDGSECVTGRWNELARVLE